MPDHKGPQDISPAVAAVFDRYPEKARARLHAVRADILALAQQLQVGPMTETLKWGEAAYLTEVTKAGSTIRLTWSPKLPQAAQALFICTTRLIDTFRERHGDTLEFVGNRAIHLPLDGTYDKAALSDCLALALTHKKRGLGQNCHA